MNIQEIRQKYPQYSDMSDEQLARALHKKYYSDMEFGDFSQRVGLQTQQAPQQAAKSGLFDGAWSLESAMEVERQKVEQLPRQLGLTVRAGIEGLAALPMAALEGGAGLANLLTGGDFSFQRELQSGLSKVLPTPETTTEKVANFGGQVFASQKLPGLPEAAPVQQTVSKADRVIQAGNKHGVPVFYDDVGGPMARRAGVAAEPLGPLGTGSGRAVQAQAAQKAAGEVADSYATGMGDDIPVLMQESLKRQLGNFRKTADHLYKRVDAGLAGRPVNVGGYRQAIDDEIARLQKLGAAGNKDAIAILEKFKASPDGDFAHMREIRSSLGDDISGFYTGANSTIGSKGVGALQRVKDVLEADMAAHAKSVGGKGYEDWKIADGFYKKNVIPFKESGFKDLVGTAEPEKAWRYLMAQKGLGSRAARMYQSLDTDGRRVVREGLIKDAIEDATDPKGVFHPARFAKYMEDHSKVVSTFFRGTDRAEIDGFTNLMRHVERAGQYAENPPTGQRVIPWLLGGAALIEPTTAAAVGAGGLTVRALLQSETGRNLLLRASKLKPGSPQMAEVEKALTRFVSSGVAAYQSTYGRDERPTEDQQQ